MYDAEDLLGKIYELVSSSADYAFKQKHDPDIPHDDRLWYQGREDMLRIILAEIRIGNYPPKEEDCG